MWQWRSTIQDGTVPPIVRSVLELTAVVKAYGPREVLREVTVTCVAGTLTSVLGSNGSGKTTLLRIAAGLLEPDGGTSAIDGLTQADGRAYRSRVAYLAAGDRGLYARLTVRQNLSFSAALRMLPAPSRHAAIEREAGRFALEELLDSRADRLSHGQRQRVRLACAWTGSPPVLLLDEPALGLDEAMEQRLAEAVAAYCAQGGTALTCSPKADLLTERAELQLRLADGRLTPA